MTVVQIVGFTNHRTPTATTNNSAELQNPRQDELYGANYAVKRRFCGMLIMHSLEVLSTRGDEVCIQPEPDQAAEQNVRK